MRHLHTATTFQEATQLKKLLQDRGIECEVREDSTAHSKAWDLWIYREDDIPLAEQIIADPASAPLVKVAPKPEPLQVKPPVFKSSNRIDLNRPCVVTIAFVLISILCTYMLHDKKYASFVRLLFFSEFGGKEFIEIRAGEYWRLITPIFLHGGFLHILFNMLWLYQLGVIVEKIEGSPFLLGFIVLAGTICNTAQYLVSGPNFIGMSGVVYALLGFIWMMSKYSMNKPYNLDKQIVGFMFIWLVVCLIGLIPHVANTQHVVGFAGGTLFGYLFSGGWKAELRRRQYKRKIS